jgi:hypothetical protein
MVFSGLLLPVIIGQVITIIGRVPENSRLFTVDLKTDNGFTGNPGDIQLHMSIRFNEGKIVRNTHDILNGPNWPNREEISDNLHPGSSLLPMTKGSPYKILILVDGDGYFISINDRPFCFFAHRRSIDEIKKLVISGDTEVFAVNQGVPRDSFWPSNYENGIRPLQTHQFQAGDVIVISAVPQGRSRGNFYIDFDDTAFRGRSNFHFRNYLNDNRCVCNSQALSLTWLPEVRAQCSAVTVGRRFRIAIAYTESAFRTAINGREIMTMTFERRPLAAVSDVNIVSEDGLYVRVESVEMFKLSPNCDGYENLSEVQNPWG